MMWKGVCTWILLGLLSVTEAAVETGPAKPVRIAKAELRTLAPTILVAGEVRTVSAADIATSLDGTISWIADIGTRVRKGARLASLDASEIRLSRLDAEAQAKRAEVVLQHAQREYERFRLAGAIVTPYQLDQAANARDLARSDLDIARTKVRALDERLSRTVLHAPADGLVVERLKRPGEHASIGDLVMRVSSTEGLEIHLSLSLRHLETIAVGTNVIVSYDGHRMSAPIRVLVPVGEARSQSFTVVVDASKLAPPPPVGKLVQVVVPLATPTRLVAVPRDALVIRSDGMAVFRVIDRRAQRVAVTTGMAERDWIAVTGPIAADDVIVIRGAESLRDGETVHIE
jgi:RND family efflux transporter MFP subunit